MSKERIDKIIASIGTLSRKDVGKLIKEARVCVNDKIVKSVSDKIDTDIDRIFIGGEELIIKKNIYIMLNKPKGVVSASAGKGEKTVVDLVPDSLKRDGLFPAGRLDKDTTGFVLITDDGNFAHNILSPKKHINKTYIAKLKNPIDDVDIKTLENGLELKDGTVFLPSLIKIIENSENPIVQIVICEGKYHQIKRMFLAVNNEVIDLNRIKMGELSLDDDLKQGECREITQNELNLIRKK
ncbi:MAG: pseudouridine synthase [Oscillospiraceae bacterium]